MREGLKIALIAGGAYMAWKFGLLSAVLPAGLVPTPPSSGATGGGGSTGATGGGGSTAAPGAAGLALTSAEIDRLTPIAAGGDVTAAAKLTAAGITYNGHQWNWFREQSGKPPAPPTPGLDAVMTATEYLAYRQSQGLGGVHLNGIALGWWG